MKNIKRILIVCTGNSCRSVMAMGYLRKRLKDLGKDIVVESAGTAALPGLGPSKDAVMAMGDIGVDISGHMSTQLSKEMIKKADIILVMEPIHKDEILRLAPEHIDKVFYFREFDTSADEYSVPDPIGMGSGFYKNVLDVIKKSTEGFLKWMEN